jgi:hypothetical protein
MDGPLLDRLAASVFALGLAHGFVRREDVIGWADRRITKTDSPPPEWLIDLSLSRDRHRLDLIGDLKRLAEGVDPAATCNATYALLPDEDGFSFDEAAALAARLYRITHDCLTGDWSNPLLHVTDALADDFDFLRDGYLAATEEQVVGAVRKFVRDHRDDAVARLLHPATWMPTPKVVSPPENGVVGPVVRVGLSAWIVQDGNYDDFTTGQEAKFALEFYPPHGLRPAAPGPKSAEHLSASRYRVHAQVVFAADGVWVIDAGLFIAFAERQPPPHAVAGAWVEGEVYVGIDPFFYFEYLHKNAEMPPLSYRWRVRWIARETTPWGEMRDAQGRIVLTRDETKEAFVPARQTDAWRDDGGSGRCVLECERLAGPEQPN